MQTVKQVVCPNCQGLNPAHYTMCDHCGTRLAPEPVARPVVNIEPAPPPDLPPLIWAIVCFFLALWGLVSSGLLAGLVGFLTHPYLLAAAALVSLVLTGVYLAERASREPPPDRMLSARDLMALSWTTAALLGATQFIKYVVPPHPVITRYEILSKAGEGCRAEVYVKGETGDELWRLTGTNRKDEKEIVGIIVRRPSGGGARLPITVRTAQGECSIVKYYLTIDGKVLDKVDGIGL